jgi:hypothetical protein
MSHPVPETHADKVKRLDELRKRKAEREAARDAEVDALELQELELEEAHLSLGKRGVDFEIVVTQVGCIVLKKPDLQATAVFSGKALAGTATDADLLMYVTPSVVVPRDVEFRALVVDHGGILQRCALALHAMYEVKVEERRGKF